MNPYSNFIINKNQKSDLGRALDIQKYAVHWITLKPQSRSSDAHAESLEEEFIYVVSGNPHVWIDGYIYELAAGDAVGFKSGTGIAHCFLNNSSKNVELIVLGEKTKPENKCSFPVNPEFFETHQKIWWKDAPLQKLGPHDAALGNLQYIKNKSECALIHSVYLSERKLGFSYPNDIEKFSLGIRLTELVDLKVLGIWHEILKPGFRTSWPHAHSSEEECALILKGQPHVWLNGFLTELKPGDLVYFKPNTNIAHVLLNNSNEDIEFLGIGEANGGGPEDKLYYPLHPRRNEECLLKGDGWVNAPQDLEFGNHDGKPSKK